MATTGVRETCPRLAVCLCDIPASQLDSHSDDWHPMYTQLYGPEVYVVQYRQCSLSREGEKDLRNSFPEWRERAFPFSSDPA